MRSKRNWKWVIIMAAVLLVFAIPTFFWVKNNNRFLAQRRKSQMSPIIMVPGSSATTERFNGLVDAMNRDSFAKHSLLKVKVATDGSVTYSGSIQRGDLEPIIVIGFANNRDGYANIKKQAGWLNIAFYNLSQQYKFNNFKAFGHSNGGLIWTYWLEHFASRYTNSIQMKRLMTLGTPYNFSEKSLSHKTQMLSDFIKNKKRIPKNLVVFSVSGGQDYESDGRVPEASVDAAKYIYQNQAKSYTTMTVTGSDAQHSSLPQNTQVVALIEQYLSDNNRRHPGHQNNNGNR